MSILFQGVDDIIKFLERVGYQVIKPEESPDDHYLVMGAYTKEPIGCTSARGREDVLFEEPDASFEKVEKSKCPVCESFE